MTNIQTALAKYASTYRAWRLSQEAKPYNIDVEVQYATADLFNLVKRGTTANALFIIADETEVLEKAVRKLEVGE